MPSCCSLPIFPDELAVPLPQEFARRLQQLYGLQSPPKDLAEWILGRQATGNLPLVAEWLISPAPTRHTVQWEDNVVHVHCALDAMMYPLLIEQDARIRSRCPECDCVVEFGVTCGELTAWTARGAALWLGVAAPSSPKPCCDREKLSASRECLCPFTNLFDSPEHLKGWQARHKEVVGVQLTLAEAFALAKGLAANPRGAP